MEHEPGLFEPISDADDAAMIARARADVSAGRGVPHDKVAEWLRTVGTPEWKPMPREWYE